MERSWQSPSAKAVHTTGWLIATSTTFHPAYLVRAHFGTKYSTRRADVGCKTGAIGILMYNYVPLGFSRIISPSTTPGAGSITFTSGTKLVKLLRTKKVTVTFSAAPAV